jgi:hypothetical protein
MGTPTKILEPIDDTEDHTKLNQRDISIIK